MGWRGDRTELKTPELKEDWGELRCWPHPLTSRRECEHFLPRDKVSLLGEIFCVCMLASHQKQHRSRAGEQEMRISKELGHRLTQQCKDRHLLLTVTTCKAVMLDNCFHWKSYSRPRKT